MYKRFLLRWWKCSTFNCCDGCTILWPYQKKNPWIIHFKLVTLVQKLYLYKSVSNKLGGHSKEGNRVTASMRHSPRYIKGVGRANWRIHTIWYHFYKNKTKGCLSVYREEGVGKVKGSDALHTAYFTITQTYRTHITKFQINTFCKGNHKMCKRCEQFAKGEKLNEQKRHSTCLTSLVIKEIIIIKQHLLSVRLPEIKKKIWLARIWY